MLVTKRDLKKEFKQLYGPSPKACEIVDVPPLNFLMIDGKGDPATGQEYKDAVEALYASAYTLKFAIKKQEGVDFPVMPLEGLWWSPNLEAFSLGQRSDWLWTMMIMQPDLVTKEHVTAALTEARAKKGLAALSRVRYESFTEGPSAQILYFGLYREEGPTIARLHSFIHDNGCELTGKHHEIYLSDPRRTAPEKLKTIIRQPLRKLV